MTTTHKAAAKCFLCSAQEAAAVLDKHSLLALNLTIRAYLGRAIRQGVTLKKPNPEDSPPPPG